MNDVIAEASWPDSARWMVAEEGGDDLFIRLLDGGKCLSQVALPFPSAGLAGGRLILSPSGRYAIVRVAGLPYTSGEAADLAFAPDEKTFVKVLPFNCLFDLAEAAEEEDCQLRDGQRVIPFGELRIHEIASGRVSLHPIEVSMAAEHEPEEKGDGAVELSAAFVSAQELQFTVPWGERVSVRLPPASENIVLHL